LDKCSFWHLVSKEFNFNKPMAVRHCSDVVVVLDVMLKAIMTKPHVC